MIANMTGINALNAMPKLVRTATQVAKVPAESDP
jgi:hypothetical protein